MAQQTIRAQTTRPIGKDRATARLFSSPYALAYDRRAVAGGLTPAEARQRYLDFVNRIQGRREPRAA